MALQRVGTYPVRWATAEARRSGSSGRSRIAELVAWLVAERLDERRRHAFAVGKRRDEAAVQNVVLERLAARVGDRNPGAVIDRN